MTWRPIAIGAGALLTAGLVGYGVGRYATPARVEVRTEVKTVAQVEWRDRVVEKVVTGPTRTVTRTIERTVPCAPGEPAPVKETTITVDAGPVVATKDTAGSGEASTASQAQTSTVTVQDAPRWLLQAGAASGLEFRPVYSLGASYRLAGPFWAGAAWQLADRRLELRAGFSF